MTGFDDIQQFSLTTRTLTSSEETDDVADDDVSVPSRSGETLEGLPDLPQIGKPLLVEVNIGGMYVGFSQLRSEVLTTKLKYTRDWVYKNRRKFPKNFSEFPHRHHHLHM